jgi:hypothetical protein
MSIARVWVRGYLSGKEYLVEVKGDLARALADLKVAKTDEYDGFQYRISYYKDGKWIDEKVYYGGNLVVLNERFKLAGGRVVCRHDPSLD